MLDIAGIIARPKVDVHAHVFHGPKEVAVSDRLVASADRLGITELWCSSPVTGGRLCSIEEVRLNNDTILRAMERHPGRIKGYCFLIPGHYKAALAEAKRCLDAGMIGIKLYNQYKIQDPAVWPVIELAIEYGVTVLEHAGYVVGPEHRAAQPLTSHGADFTEVSQRYPEATLLHAHIGGGGDWEWTIRAMRDASPNVVCDVSGSNLDTGQVELAVRVLGAHRVLFGTDGTMEGSLGKVLGAELTEEERELILRKNAERLLARRRIAPASSIQAALAEVAATEGGGGR